MDGEFLKCSLKKMACTQSFLVFKKLFRENSPFFCAIFSWKPFSLTDAEGIEFAASGARLGELIEAGASGPCP